MRLKFLFLLILLVGCGGSGQSELSQALEDCLHKCVPGDEGCRDHCISVCVDGCLGDCPGWECKPILVFFRGEDPYGWPQDCADSTSCMQACWCFDHETCLAVGELVFGPDAPCPDSLYDSCKDICYAF